MSNSNKNQSDDSGNRNQQAASGENAKGSSNRGDQPSASQRNQGGGQDQEKANQTKNTTAYNSEYSNAGSAPSSANDGGTIDDADNRDAK
ncbi:hypothetical protein [Hymenobacter koreensis]|uniref:Uncharacterized protein n=1 Tax=Hymenobacter koreensis TaxID=1084523 RepID=A0ABP8IUX2_9BACT